MQVMNLWNQTFFCVSLTSSKRCFCLLSMSRIRKVSAFLLFRNLWASSAWKGTCKLQIRWNIHLLKSILKSIDIKCIFFIPKINLNVFQCNTRRAPYGIEGAPKTRLIVARDFKTMGFVCVPHTHTHTYIFFLCARGGVGWGVAETSFKTAWFFTQQQFHLHKQHTRSALK